MTSRFAPRICMRRPATIFTPLVALLAAATLLTNCALLQKDLQPPRITLASITPAQSTITELRFRCRLRLDNPNDVSLPIKGGELQLTLAEQAAASGQLAGKVTVPAGGSAEVDAIVAIDVMSIVGMLPGVLSQPDAMLQYKIDGFVDVGLTRLGRIRFDDSGRFSLNGTGVADLTRL